MHGALHSRREAVLVVFARLPVSGKTKTRLAAGVGADAAAQFSALCAECVFVEAARCRFADALVACAAADDVSAMQSWLQSRGMALPVIAQAPAPDLGARMLAALTMAVCCCGVSQEHVADLMHCSDTEQKVKQQQQEQQQQQQQQQQQEVLVPVVAAAQPPPPLRAAAAPACGTYAAAIVVGSDVPDLAAPLLDAAVAALRTHDVVLGPAQDGGFWLLGLRTDVLLSPSVQAGLLFDGVTWSTASVLASTAASVARLGLSLAPLSTLPTLRDIDTLADAAVWLQGAANSCSMTPASLSPRTALLDCVATLVARSQGSRGTRTHASATCAPASGV